MVPMSRILGAGAVVAVAVAAALLWRGEDGGSPAAPAQPASEPASVAQSPAAAEAPASTASGAASGAAQQLAVPAAEAPLAAADVEAALVDLLGRKAVSNFLQTDEFARRFVATVDNLGRTHAPSRLWPVNPMPDRFAVEEHEGSTVIATDNSLRYTPFVLLVETVSVARAVDLYVRLYPELQRSYEALGYPRGYFNDRLLQVIELLLATPQAEYPLRVRLTEVKGPIPSEQPWTRYEFADAGLESLSAGQKMLLRTGEVNARRLKGKLAELRSELLARARPR